MRSDILRVLAIVASTAVLPMTAVAQTRFPSPGDHVDFTHYTLPDQCWAAVGRVTDSVHFRQRRDTLPFDASEPRPAAVVQSARRCIANFSVARVDANSLRPFRDLALAAGDDSLAARAVAREFANAAAQPDSTRAEILLDAIRASLDARPARMGLARQFVTQLDRLGPRVSLARVAARVQLMELLIAELRDTSAIYQLGREMSDLVDHAPQDVRAANPQGWNTADNLVRLAAIWRKQLTESPAAGLAELKARGWDTGTMLGRRASPIDSPYWFNRPDQAPRPGAGKLSLVIYADATCRTTCQPAYAVLRRLARAHPDVEVTMFTDTHGWFGRRLTTKAADEAELLRQYFLEHHRLPGALAIDSTPHTRLPSPDDRRIDNHATNNANYGYRERGLDHATTNVDYFVVGPDGLITFTGFLSPQTERQIHAEILAIKRSMTPTRAGQ